MPIICVESDLSCARGSMRVPDRYAVARVLVRWGATPVGQVDVPVRDGRLDIEDIWPLVAASLGSQLARTVVEHWWAFPRDEPSAPVPPTCSVVVCTRARPSELDRCLRSIRACSTDVEIVVVDNAPPDDASAETARSHPVRYVREARRGLNWARSRGAREATGDIVMFVDDDVVVDRRWVDAMRRPFADRRVAAVTGLIVPLELETPAQEAFERFAGFLRGFERISYSSQVIAPVLCAKVGSGASMAFRRDLIVRMALFDCEMDAGTATRSGGDHYAFYQLLRAGHLIQYEPSAVAWHRHRRTDTELRSALYGYSVGVYCYLLRCLLHHRDLGALRVAIGWFVSHHFRQLLKALRHDEDAQPVALTIAEWRGALAAPWAYLRTFRDERRAVHTAPTGK